MASQAPVSSGYLKMRAQYCQGQCLVQAHNYLCQKKESYFCLLQIEGASQSSQKLKIDIASGSDRDMEKDSG